MQDYIPYNVWLAQHNLLTKTKRFPRSQRSFSLSDEAIEGLYKLATVFTTDNEVNIHSVTKMLEALGQNQLTLNKPVELEMEGTTTSDCYDAGAEDAQEKRPPNFNLIFNNLPREFEEAYRRGYLENK